MKLDLPTILIYSFGIMCIWFYIENKSYNKKLTQRNKELYDKDKTIYELCTIITDMNGHLRLYNILGAIKFISDAWDIMSEYQRRRGIYALKQICNSYDKEVLGKDYSKKFIEDYQSTTELIMDSIEHLHFGSTQEEIVFVRNEVLYIIELFFPGGDKVELVKRKR